MGPESIPIWVCPLSLQDDIDKLGGYDEGGHVLKIKGVRNHPAPGGNIMLTMGGNSTQDWLRKTLQFWRDGSKWPSDRSQGVQRSTFTNGP